MTAGSTELVVGESTLVTATVVDVNGDPVVGVRVRFSEGPAVASIDRNVKTTDANGQASAAFVATEAGSRQVTATVVDIDAGVIIDSAVSGSATITVSAAGAAAATVTISVAAGGQFFGWTGGTATASQVFGDASIAWLWTGTAWVSFVPILGTTNFEVNLGDALFVNFAAATDIEAPAP